MQVSMSLQAKRELLVRVAGRYRDATEQQFLDAVLRLCPQVDHARTLVRDFAALLQQRQGHATAKLEGWLVAAEHSGIVELRGFAHGVRRDLAAVKAALTLEWSHEYVAHCTSSLGW